jgi:hypothetical protein
VSDERSPGANGASTGPLARVAKSGDARIYQPRPIGVRVDKGGSPQAVAGVAVDGTREEWLVEDRWWTPHPLRRHYFELVLTDGSCIVVFRDLTQGDWFSQRA